MKGRWQQDAWGLCLQHLPARCFTPESLMAEHVMRMMGRRLRFDAIPPTRLDREGYDLVDLDTQSAPKWKAWRKGFGDGTMESRLLCLLQAGCIGSPPRRFWRPRAMTTSASVPFVVQTCALYGTCGATAVQ